MLTDTALKHIRGKLPQLKDAGEWSPEKFMQFLKFVTFFSVIKSPMEANYQITNETLDTARGRIPDEPWWDEFFARIDPTPGLNYAKSFRQRFITFVRIPCGWLKRNPHFLTPEMYALMDPNPRLSWASRNFKMVETEMGMQVVERDNDELTDPAIKNKMLDVTSSRTPLVIYQETLLKYTTILNSLIKGIPSAELKTIGVAKRIELLNNGLKTLSQLLVKQQPNRGVFTQINIAHETREKLEASILTYSEESQNQ